MGYVSTGLPACYRRQADTGLLVALLVLMSPLATAGTGLGTGTVRGNQLNPAGQPPGLTTDAAGLNPFSESTRNATGLLYPDPVRYPALKPLGDSDWLYSGSAEAGYLATFGTTDTASFPEYGDWSEAPILNRFSVSAENPRTAYYIDVTGGGVARDDQYYRLSLGKYGVYNIAAFFDTTPHVFASNARVLWDGAGSESLTLPAGLTPGASSLTEVLAAFQSRGGSTLAVERDKARLAVDVTRIKNLRLFAGATVEWRDGTRPFGGAFTYPGLGQVTETVEPINYTTYDINAGLQYSGERYQFNLSYAGSFFENGTETLTWENPGLSAIPNQFLSLVPQRGRFALAPDNEYHNVRGDLAMPLPLWRGRATASVSYSHMRQNSALLPPTVSAGTVGNGATAINLALWNSTAALSTDRADAAIDNLLLHTKLILTPLPKLRLTGEFRYRDEDNKTDYTAFNPLTGEYGYIALDGGLAAVMPNRTGVFNPALPGSRVRFRNIPFAKDTLLIALAADYRLTRATKLAADYEREHTEHAHRERERTHEDRLRLQLTHRRMGKGTLRISYEYGDRGGDAYNFNPYEPFYTSSLPPFTPLFADGNAPHTLSALRKFDLASREQHTLDARLNLIIGERMDLILSGRYENTNYAADFGLQGSNTTAANVEWNYQFTRNGSVNAYYSWQAHERDIANINDAGAIAADPTAGGAVFPLANAWSESIDEDNHVLGAGFSAGFGDLTVDLSYNFVYAKSRFHYRFASPAAFFGPFSTAQAGGGFPDQTYRHHLLEGNLRWRFREDMTLRLLYRYEREDLADFHYDGLTGPVIGADIFLAAVPEDYAAHVLGILLETSF